MDIREACKSDINKIAEMVTNYLKTSPFTSFSPVDRKSITDTLKEVINDSNHVLLVATDNGKVVGTILGQVLNNFIAKSKLACREMFWWVEPEYRKYGLGNVLISELEMKVKVIGATYLSVGCASTVKLNMPEQAVA